MARNDDLDLGGFRISPIIPTGNTQPSAPTAAGPLGAHIEKGFSSTPTASDAVALQPADVSVPAGGSGAGKSDHGATQPATTPDATTRGGRR
jgi:hypothetical protein